MEGFIIMLLKIGNFNLGVLISHVELYLIYFLWDKFFFFNVFELKFFFRKILF